MRKDELIAAIDGIDGWLADDEAWALHRIAHDAPGTDPLIVEIGSWMGRSTIAMALAFAERGTGTVVAVDPHAGGYLRTEHAMDSWSAFERNVAAAGVEAHVRPIVAQSVDARRQVEGPIDALFVDGLHRYETVMLDIDTWEDALRPGATVAFHDYGIFRGLTEALHERVLAPGPFRRPRVVSRVLLVEYRPGPWTRQDAAAAAAVRARTWVKLPVAAALRGADHIARRLTTAARRLA